MSSYDDGFLDAAMIGNARQQNTDIANKQVFDRVVRERDDLRKRLAEVEAQLASTQAELREIEDLHHNDWASARLKHSLYIGFKLALQELENEIRGVDPSSVYTRKSGLARSSAPSDELSYVEVLGWQKSLKDLEWSLEELSGPHKDIFWSHVHKVFKFTFIQCTSPDASPVPEEFQQLLEWSRPDAELIKQYEP